MTRLSSHDGIKFKSDHVLAPWRIAQLSEARAIGVRDGVDKADACERTALLARM